MEGSFVLAVASGKGGTGKTTIAVNLLYTAAQYLNDQVQLVDCDVEEPNAALFFPESHLVAEEKVLRRIPEINTAKCTWCRKCSDYCEFNAITVLPPVEVAEVAADLCHSCNACLHACPVDAIRMVPDEMGIIRRYTTSYGGYLTEGELMVGKPLQTPVIRELIRRTGNFSGLTLLDAPPGTSCSVVSTVRKADRVLLVIEPTLFGLHDAELVIGLLKELQIPYDAVINKAELGDRKLQDFLEKHRLNPLVSIPFRKEYAEAYSRGKILSASFARYQQVFEALFQQISVLIPES